MKRLLPFTFAAVVACDRGSAGPGSDPHEQELGHEHEEGSGHDDEVTLTPESIARHGIVVEAAALHALVPTINVPARVDFNGEAMAHVGCPVRGRVAELGARLGDVVEKGQELLVIESAELGEAQSEFLLKNSAAHAAEPAVELSRNALERARNLYESTQGITLTEVQKREAEFHAAEAALVSARTARSAAENRLHLFGMSQEAIERLATTSETEPRYRVLAPIAGTVVEREVTLGELVDAEREALLVLADMTRLWILADVPEARLREIAVAGAARVRLGVEQDHWCEGTVTLISPTVDAATRSVRVRIVATDRHPELRPGIFAQAELVLQRDATAPQLAIPESALQTIEGAACVFVPVEGEPGTFARRAVEVGPAVGGLLPVRSGLVEGERFVARGSFLLKAELGKGSAEHEH
jgi:cobalt-zinc-cadmium efflux system membrane fusion protein